MRAPAAPPGSQRGRALARAAAALVFVGTGCLSARGTAQRPLVHSFRIEGARAVRPADVVERLATQPSGRWFWQTPHWLDRDALDTDVKRIERYYQARGYYDARVEDVDVRAAGGQSVDVVVRVVEGEPVRVADVRVEGLEAAPQAPVPVLPIRVDDVFTESAFDAGRAAVLDALHDNGYPRAEVTQRAEVDRSTRRARVVYDVQPGERYRFGSIQVFGNHDVPSARVRQQAEVVITPGATFDESRLPRAQARVFDLGVFGGVRAMHGNPDRASGTLPVVLEVSEAPFHTIRAGPGFEISPVRWDLRANAGWTDRNFLGGLRRLTLDGYVGYAWIPNPYTATFSGVLGLARADFLQPEFFGPWIDLGTRVELERGIEQAYDFTSERFSIGLPLRLGRAWTVVPSYNLQVYQLGARTAQFNPLERPSSTSLLFLQDCPRGVCVLSYVEERFAWDGRDNPFDPTTGAYLGISMQQGFRLGSYGFRYVRVLPEARAYVPVWRDIVWALRLRAGVLVPLGADARPESEQTPIVARFASGGPLAMRGYYTRRLSPMIYIANPSQYLPIGGNGLLDGSLEVRFPLAGKLGATAFLDFGNVTGRSWDVFRLSDLQAAAGIGVHYKSPVGPVGLQVATRLPNVHGQWPGVPLLAATTTTVTRPDGSLATVTTVSPAGVHHEPIVSVHVSIGEAF